MNVFTFKIKGEGRRYHFQIGWFWLIIPAIILIVLLAGCGSKPNNNNYNNGWGQHYYGGQYDPFFNYGLGTYVQNNRTYYIVPTQPPPKNVKTATVAPKTTAPMPTGTQPKPIQVPEKTQPKTTAPKANVNTPKPAAPPKAQQPKPAPKPAPKAGK